MKRFKLLAGITACIAAASALGLSAAAQTITDPVLLDASVGGGNVYQIPFANLTEEGIITNVAFDVTCPFAATGWSGGGGAVGMNFGEEWYQVDFPEAGTFVDGELHDDTFHVSLDIPASYNGAAQDLTGDGVVQIGWWWGAGDTAEITNLEITFGEAPAETTTTEGTGTTVTTAESDVTTSTTVTAAPKLDYVKIFGNTLADTPIKVEIDGEEVELVAHTYTLADFDNDGTKDLVVFYHTNKAAAEDAEKDVTEDWYSILYTYDGTEITASAPLADYEYSGMFIAKDYNGIINFWTDDQKSSNGQTGTFDRWQPADGTVEKLDTFSDVAGFDKLVAEYCEGDALKFYAVEDLTGLQDIDPTATTTTPVAPISSPGTAATTAGAMKTGDAGVATAVASLLAASAVAGIALVKKKED